MIQLSSTVSTSVSQLVEGGITIALAASGCESAKVLRKLRLLSYNGSSYISDDLAKYLEDKGMKHVCSAPMHPQT